MGLNGLYLWLPIYLYWAAILILLFFLVYILFRHVHTIKQRGNYSFECDSGGDAVSDMELPAGNSRDRISGNAETLSPDDVGDIRDRVCNRRSIRS